jgi:hypothetical protein
MAGYLSAYGRARAVQTVGDDPYRRADLKCNQDHNGNANCVTNQSRFAVVVSVVAVIFAPHRE